MTRGQLRLGARATINVALLVDEIFGKEMLSKLGDQSLPESVRMILVLNPAGRGQPLTLPPSFLHVTLTTPYRSTIAITRLARFIAKCKGLVVPEGDFGSDVEGTKPILFEIGEDASTLDDILFYLWSHLGRDSIILTDSLPQLKSIREMVQQFGGFWQSCYHVNDSFLEGEQVVAITTGANAMELITKAHTWLCVILVEEEEYLFTQTKKQFQKLALEIKTFILEEDWYEQAKKDIAIQPLLHSIEYIDVHTRSDFPPASTKYLEGFSKMDNDDKEKMLESRMITIGKGIIENKPIEEADFRKVVYLALFGPGR